MDFTQYVHVHAISLQLSLHVTHHLSLLCEVSLLPSEEVSAKPLCDTLAPLRDLWLEGAVGVGLC